MEIFSFLLTDFVYSVISLPSKVLSIAVVMLFLELGLLGLYYGAMAGEKSVKEIRNLRAGRKPDEDADPRDGGIDEAPLLPSGGGSWITRIRAIDYLILCHTVVEKTARIMKPALAGMTTVMGGSLIGFLLVNQFFLSVFVDNALNGNSDVTGVLYTYDDFSGNLINGKMHFKGITIVKRRPHESAYKIQVDDLDMQINFTSLFMWPIRINHLHIKGLDGKLLTRGEPISWHSVQHFLITHLSVNDLKVAMMDKQKKRTQVNIATFNSGPIRSEYAPLDLVFRSNVEGQIDESPFKISTVVKAGARETEWVLEDFPAMTLSKVIEAPPIDWFKQGLVTMHATKVWPTETSDKLTARWNLNFRGLKVLLPEDLAPFRVAMYQPIANEINSGKGEIQVEIKLELDEASYPSPYRGLKELWRQAGRQIMEKISPDGEVML